MTEEERETVFSATLELNCECSVEMCEHQNAALLKVIQDAWQSGRKAGIATVIGKMKEAAEHGLVLRLNDGELELPKSFSDLDEPSH